MVKTTLLTDEWKIQPNSGGHNHGGCGGHDGVMIKTAATVASLVKVSPAILRLTAMLTVLSDFFVKIVFSLSNTFVAVAPLVCP